MIGETLGRYKVLSKLGEDGVGVVYTTEHPLLGKKAVVKLLHAVLSKNEDLEPDKPDRSRPGPT